MSELTKRVLFAVIAAPLALWIVLAGGAPLAALLAIVCAIGAWEFFRLSRATGALPLDDVGIALAGLTPLAVHASYLGVFQVKPAFVAVIMLAVCAATIWLRGVEGKPMGAAANTVFGVLYTGGMLSFGYALRYHDSVMGYDNVGASHLGPIAITPGGLLLLFPMLVTWASDTGAFFVGRAIGGPKLIPKVSPGKTRSGAIGGLVASVIVSYIFARYVLAPVAHLGLSPLGAVIFGASISIAAQAGDLFESLIKREAGAKDSSRIIPGHGGVLDRFDSLIFVLPLAYVLLGWLPIPVFG